MARGHIEKRKVKGSARREEYRYDVRVDLGPDPETGKRRQRKQTVESYQDARKLLSKWTAEIDEGTVVDRSEKTVADVLREWLTTYAAINVRPVSLWHYTHTIEHHIIPQLGHIPVQRLTAADVQRFYADKRAAGCGARTVQLCHLRLAQALKQALRQGIVTRNVCDLVDPPKAPAAQRQVWTTEQTQRFLAVADRAHYGPIWRVALMTGLRRGELLGLRWQDIDWESRCLYIRQAMTMVNGRRTIGPLKTKASRRTIPMPQELLDLLHAHRAQQNARRLEAGPVWEGHDLVFCTKDGRPINACQLIRDFNHWCLAAGVPRIRIHDLRHLFISTAIRLGADIKSVAEIVGHSKTAITMEVYTHTTQAQHEAVVDKVSAAYRAMPATPEETP